MHVPAATPVTIPLPDTVADVLLQLQTPPGVASVRGIVAPAHTTDDPVMVPAEGTAGMTVMAFVAETVPQELVTEYLIVSDPATTPVISPAETVADVLLLLHTPPAVASVSEIVEPAHTFEAPVTVPAVANGLTVISLVAVAEPHELVTA